MAISLEPISKMCPQLTETSIHMDLINSMYFMLSIILRMIGLWHWLNGWEGLCYPLWSYLRQCSYRWEFPCSPYSTQTKVKNKRNIIIPFRIQADPGHGWSYSCSWYSRALSNISDFFLISCSDKCPMIVSPPMVSTDHSLIFQWRRFSLGIL